MWKPSGTRDGLPREAPRLEDWRSLPSRTSQGVPRPKLKLNTGLNIFCWMDGIWWYSRLPWFFSFFFLRLLLSWKELSSHRYPSIQVYRCQLTCKQQALYSPLDGDDGNHFCGMISSWVTIFNDLQCIRQIVCSHCFSSQSIDDS